MKYTVLQHEWKVEGKKSIHNIKSKVRKVFDDDALDGKALEKCGEYLAFLGEMRELGELPKTIGFSILEER